MDKTYLYNTLTGKWHRFASRRSADVAKSDSDYWVEEDQAPLEAWPDPPPDPPPSVPKYPSKATKKAAKKAAPKATDTEGPPDTTDDSKE